MPHAAQLAATSSTLLSINLHNEDAYLPFDYPDEIHSADTSALTRNQAIQTRSTKIAPATAVADRPTKSTESTSLGDGKGSKTGEGREGEKDRGEVEGDGSE